MNLASLSAIIPGFQQGQQNALALKRKQEEQAAIDRQKQADAIRAAWLMGDIGNLSDAPPGGSAPQGPAPVPQGAGQPSVPAGGGPQPLGGVAQPVPPGYPPPGYPMPQMNAAPGQPRPPMGTMPQRQPGPAPGPQPGGAPPGGGAAMSLQQMAQSIMRAPGNRGIDWQKPENKQALLMAVEKNQQLLVPQGKAELAAAKQELAVQALMSKIDMANKTLEFKQSSEQDRMRAMQETNMLRMQIAQITDSRARDALIARLQQGDRRLDQSDRRLEQGDKRLDQSAAKPRADLVKMATKAGVTVTSDMETDDIQKKVAEAAAKGAGGKAFDDATAQFLAEAMRTDPSIISHIGSGQSANANKQKILEAYSKLPGVDPSSLAMAKVALQGASSESRKVGTQAGSVLLGTKEIEEFAPLVLSAAKKVDASKYPTVNAMVQATQRGTGEPEIVTLVNNIQALKSAYTQILTRGGVPGVEAQKRADELINPTMAPAQIAAAVAAMKAEGAGAGRAATKAGKVVSDKAGGHEAAPAESGDTDPLGILK